MWDREGFSFVDTPPEPLPCLKREIEGFSVNAIANYVYTVHVDDNGSTYIISFLYIILLELHVDHN